MINRSLFIWDTWQWSSSITKRFKEVNTWYYDKAITLNVSNLTTPYRKPWLIVVGLMPLFETKQRRGLWHSPQTSQIKSNNKLKISNNCSFDNWIWSFHTEPYTMQCPNHSRNYSSTRKKLVPWRCTKVYGKEFSTKIYFCTKTLS